MDKRKRLIELINGEDWKDNLILIPKDDKRKGKLDPSFSEYLKIRGYFEKRKFGLISFSEGAFIDEEGEVAEENRAYWREYIKEHKDEVENGL